MLTSRNPPRQSSDDEAGAEDDDDFRALNTLTTLKDREYLHSLQRLSRLHDSMDVDILDKQDLLQGHHYTTRCNFNVTTKQRNDYAHTHIWPTATRNVPYAALCSITQKSWHWKQTRFLIFRRVVEDTRARQGDSARV
jgi:hypothetical protein